LGAAAGVRGHEGKGESGGVSDLWDSYGIPLANIMFYLPRAAAAAKAVAAMTSSSLVGMVPHAALANILPAALPAAPRIPTPEIHSPLTPGSNDNSSSAMDQAMAATLASIEVPQQNGKCV